MKIGQKITLSFVMVEVILIIAMIVSLVNLSNLNTLVDNITHDRVVKSRMAYKLLDNLDAQRLLIRNMIISHDLTKTKELAVQIPAYNQEIDSVFNVLKNLLVTPEGKALVEPIIETGQAYRTLLGQTMSLKLEDKQAESEDHLMQILVPAGVAYRDNVIKLRDQVNNHIDQGADEASSTYDSSKLILIIILVIGVVVVIGMTLLLSRSITKPITQAVNAADALSAGNMNVDLKSTAKDETGMLMASLSKMTDTIKSVVNENNLLADAAINGDFKYRANASKFEGEYKSMVEGTNGIVEAFAVPLTVLKDYLIILDNGEIPDPIPDDKGGDFVAIKDAVNHLRDTLLELDKDSKYVANGAKNGQIVQTRADVAKHKGIYRDILGGFNEALDAICESLNETMQVLGRLVEGDLDARMVQEYKGDFAVLKANVNNTFDSLPLAEIMKVMGAMANGDLTVHIDGDYKGDNLKIKNAVNDSLSSLNEILGNVKHTVDEVTRASMQVSDTSQALSQGATEQAASLEEITSSMNQIGSQTKLNAENSGIANTLAGNARDAAEKGNAEMSQLTNAMTEINTSSNNISKIIKVIDDIAFQTNLLALNAAVEAARAGRHGKGFAVVAEEVRSLAARSAKAAKETSEMIEHSIKTVDRGNELVHQTGEALTEIHGQAIKVADIIAEITTSSNEQAQGISQINEGLNQIDRVTQTNTASAEESASAAEQLSGQASQLRELVDRFKLTGNFATNYNSAPQSRRSMSHSKKSLPAKQYHATPVREEDFYDLMDNPPADKRNLNPRDIINLDEGDFDRY